jgi:hypothetical protein
LVLLAVLVLAVVCWVIGSQARTDRASQLLRACRGVPAAEPAAPAAGTGAMKRTRELVTRRKRQVT